MRRAARDNPVLARGPRVPGQVAVFVPGRRSKHRATQRGQSGGSLDGRVGGVLLRHDARFGI